MKGADQLARLMKVLAVGSRVAILQLLKERALCVNALAARLDLTQSAVSQHLRIMRDAGLVIDEKRGYFVHYRLNGQTLELWRQEINRLLDAAQEVDPDAVRDSPCSGAKRQRKTGKCGKT